MSCGEGFKKLTWHCDTVRRGLKKALVATERGVAADMVAAQPHKQPGTALYFNWAGRG
jgi:hypothetical protein